MGHEPRLVFILSAHVLFSCFDLLFLLVLEFTLSSRVLSHFRDILRLPLSDLLVFHSTSQAGRVFGVELTLVL